MNNKFTKLQMKVLRQLIYQDDSYGSILAHHIFTGEPATKAGCVLVDNHFDFDVIANYFYKVLVLPNSLHILIAIDTRFYSDTDIDKFENLIRFYND